MNEKKSIFQIDIIVGDKKEKEIQEEKTVSDEEKKKILEYAFELLNTNSRKNNQKLLGNIKEKSNEILKKL